MNKYLFFMIFCGVFLINGCATTGPIRGAAASNAIYTDASREVAFQASNEALLKLGYTILQKEPENFFIKGSYYNPLTGYSPLIAQINISQETSGAKITCSIDQSGTIKAFDILGYYPMCINKIYNQIDGILSSKGYRSQKGS